MPQSDERLKVWLQSPEGRTLTDQFAWDPETDGRPDWLRRRIEKAFWAGVKHPYGRWDWLKWRIKKGFQAGLKKSHREKKERNNAS